MSESINALIRQAYEEAARETDATPEAAFAGEPSWPMEVKIGRGLEGAIAATSKIGYVNGQLGRLVYRGYNCFDLALHSTFEETSYLLLYGKLPSREELERFHSKLVDARPVREEVFRILREIPISTTHPMYALSIGIAALGTFDENCEVTTVEAETEVSIKLIAQVGTLAAGIARLRAGHDPIDPDPTLSHAANFLWMVNGKKPGKDTARAMDVAMILHADHGMNASTFTTMVVNATLSDMYSSVVAGIASLKGSLHGGANERVLYQLEEIGDVSNVDSWFAKAKAEKRKVMGMGHRVYKAYDPRGRILEPIAGYFAERDEDTKRLYDIAVALDQAVTADLGESKKIYPNVDFYSGLVYRAMLIETALFTPIFAVSRVAGWTARALEHLADNRLFRPRAIYTGELDLDYVPMSER